MPIPIDPEIAAPIATLLAAAGGLAIRLLKSREVPALPPAPDGDVRALLIEIRAAVTGYTDAHGSAIERADGHVKRVEEQIHDLDARLIECLRKLDAIERNTERTR